MPQVQGQMWVSGRNECWFMSYYPGLPPFIKWVMVDPKFHEALDTHLPTFIDELLAGPRTAAGHGRFARN